MNFGIDWSPKNIPLVDGQTEITITFTAVNYDATLYPGTNVGWEFEGGEKGNGQGAEVTFQLPTDNPQELIDFSTNGMLIISGGLCNDFISDNTEITVTFNDEEPKNCNEKVTADIIRDRNGLPTGDNIPDKIRTDVIDPTLRLYDETIIPNLGDYLSGNKNSDLPGIFPGLTNTTADLISEIHNSGDADEITMPLSKYLIAQIKLLYHLLHCQEEFTDESVNDIKMTIDGIEQALLTLSNIPFDHGDPDPSKPEGSLRQFLIDCRNDPAVSNIVKDRIDDLIALIIPVQG